MGGDTHKAPGRTAASHHGAGSGAGGQPPPPLCSPARTGHSRVRRSPPPPLPHSRAGGYRAWGSPPSLPRLRSLLVRLRHHLLGGKKGGGEKVGVSPMAGSGPPGREPPPPPPARSPPALTCPSRVSMVLMSTILRAGLSAGCGSSTGAQRGRHPPMPTPGVQVGTRPPWAEAQGPTCSPVGCLPQPLPPPPHLSFSC